MKRLREVEDNKEKLKLTPSSSSQGIVIPPPETQRIWADTLAVTIQGIAAGMQNTG